MMRTSWRRMGLLAFLATLVVTAMVLAPQPDTGAQGAPGATGSTVTASTTGNVTTVTIDVRNIQPAGTRWRDIRLIPPRGHSLPTMVNPASGNVDVAPADDPGTPGVDESATRRQGWEFDQGNANTVTVYTGTGGSDPQGFGNTPTATDDPATPGTDESDGDGNGQADPRLYTFQITWKGDPPFTLRSCNWELTDGGIKNDTTPIATDGGPQSVPGVTLPTAMISVNGDDPLDVFINMGTVIPCATETGFNGASYVLYTSHSLLDAMDPDPDGLGIDLSDPIPSAWGLDLDYTEGFVGSDGQPVQPVEVTVPNDPGLIGHFFYCVFAVLDANQDVLFCSSPVKITIQ